MRKRDPLPVHFVVILHERLRKDLIRIARAGRKDIVRKAAEMLERLQDDPYTHRSGMVIRRLRGFAEPVFRIRIGEYRLVYVIDEKERKILATSLVHREQSY